MDNALPPFCIYFYLKGKQNVLVMISYFEHEYGKNDKKIDILGIFISEKINGCNVKAVKVPEIPVRECDKLDTGNPNDKVYTRDLFRRD